jgi:hypothetical protein
MLKGTTYNTAFFIDILMPRLIENIASKNRRETLKGWMIHLADAPSHNSRPSQECVNAFKAEQLPDRADSPEVVPTDFVCLREIKKISDYNCASQPDLLKPIAEIFG